MRFLTQRSLNLELSVLLILMLLSHACQSTYYSQLPSQQDAYVHQHYFKNIRKGTFVDIGAYGGVEFSNTYFFEKELGWKGICIEPNPEQFVKLKAARKCICIQGCISDMSGQSKLVIVRNADGLSGLLHKYDKNHLDKINQLVKDEVASCEIIDVECYLFNDLVKKHNIFHIDFLSIDTEGGEFDIISSIDFDTITIDVITVEDNYNDKRFTPFLKDKGFTFVTRLAQDLLFVRNDFSSKNTIKNKPKKKLLLKNTLSYLKERKDADSAA